MKIDTIYEQYRKGDAQALDLLLTRARKIALALARRFNVVDPEDLAQDAVIRVLENLAIYEPTRASFATWVGSMAKNMALDSHRRTRDIEDIETATLPEPSAVPLMTRIDISHLCNADRWTLLEFTESPNFEAAAKKLGISVPALQRRLYRIAKKNN
jgi:RNA polymerase sigma factor (sigma-70 family)